MENAEIKKAYRAGKSLGELAKETGIPHHQIRERLLSIVVKLRSPREVARLAYRGRTDIDIAEVVRMRDAGKTYGEICTAMNCSTHAIADRMRAAGVGFVPKGYFDLNETVGCWSPVCHMRRSPAS